jgi:protein gp37
VPPLEPLTFQFLTKNPERYSEFPWPPNCWLGATVTGESERDAGEIWALMKAKAQIHFVSYEPLLALATGYSGLDWQITGPQTRPIRQPEKWWVDRLFETGVPTFMKRKLAYEPHLEQWPLHQKAQEAQSQQDEG